MKSILWVFTILASIFIGGEAYAADTINVNTASVEQLQEVKGIGPKTAAAIIEYRKQNGAFSSLSSLTAIKGIGVKKLEKLKVNLTVEAVKPE